MDAATLAFAVVVAAFALVTGANDGSTIVAVGLKLAPAVLPGVVLLAVAVVLAPVVLGTGVATTYALRLVDDGDGTRFTFAAAALAAVVTVGGLAWSGLPTSLTLALLGGLGGAAVGAGHVVAWRNLAVVLVVAACVPPAAAAVAVGIRGLVAAARPAGGAARLLRRLHGLGFAVVATAYGANDGQKMLAVAAVAAGSAGRPAEASVGMLTALGGLFLLGSVAGLARAGRTLDRGLLATRPAHAVGAELAGGSVVLLAAWAAAPVSITQAVAGGLVGAGAAEGTPRVRWRAVARLAGAWACTLPTAFALGAMAGVGGRWA